MPDFNPGHFFRLMFACSQSIPVILLLPFSLFPLPSKAIRARHGKTMSEITLRVNGSERKIDVPGDTPLLWVLRDTLDLTGTKYGCGAGLCGACTVHLDGEAVHSCVTPVSVASGKAITTIEGLSQSGPHPLQQAWIAEDVPQCGYCQSGQIMQAAALLLKTPHPSEQEVIDAMTGNLCRCGTYHRIRRAIQRAALAGGGGR